MAEIEKLAGLMIIIEGKVVKDVRYWPGQEKRITLRPKLMGGSEKAE